MQHKIVFVVGMPRTGTSILVKCLEKSGYNIGEKVYGHKYKSQDGAFRFSNRKIMRLLCEQLKHHNPKKPVSISEDMADEVKKVFRYVMLYRIDVLKDPLFYELLGIYAAVNPGLFEHKFIWTHRDPLETAKSAVRLKYMSGVPELEPRSNFTVNRGLKRSDAYNAVHETYRPKCDGIDVYFEDLLNDTQSVSRKLSNFLGREFDASMISKHETFKATGVPQ